MNQSKNLHLPFWIFSISIIVISILPSLIQDGMFIDGIQYAAISKNLANKLGTFWFPYLNETWLRSGSSWFLEHPPLVYALQSIFFRLLGDSIFVERVYSLTTAGISAFIIFGIWKLIYHDRPEMKRMGWLPLLFWIMMPIVYRAYQMNVQENTMEVFILASVYFSFRAIRANQKQWIFVIISAICVFLATFCKGVPGLFPIVFFALYWLIVRKISFLKAFLYSLILVLIPVLIYALLLVNADARESLGFYFRERLIGRIHHEPVVDHHFHIISRLFIDLLPLIIVNVIFLIINRAKSLNVTITKMDQRLILFFFVLGLSGTLPLATTLVQRDFYMSPALPFFGISFAMIAAPFLNFRILRINMNTRLYRLFRLFAFLLLFSGISYSLLQVGKSERDHDVLHDMYLLGEKIDPGSTVGFVFSDPNQWSFVLYMARHFTISLDPNYSSSKYLVRENGAKLPSDVELKLVDTGTKVYELYEIKISGR